MILPSVGFLWHMEHPQWLSNPSPHRESGTVVTPWHRTALCQKKNNNKLLLFTWSVGLSHPETCFARGNLNHEESSPFPCCQEAASLKNPNSRSETPGRAQHGLPPRRHIFLVVKCAVYFLHLPFPFYIFFFTFTNSPNCSFPGYSECGMV